MAEFCLECWNKMNNTNDGAEKFFLTDELELCEGCGEWKQVIITECKGYYAYKLRYLLLPFKIICGIIYFICRLILSPNLIYKDNKSK